MSSSRSVAAARARRAGDIVQKPPMSVRQQQQQMMGQRPNPNQRMTAPAAVAPMPEPMQQERRPKIEVGTAIGLVTLRLGRLEQFIQEIAENGHIKKDLIAGGGAPALPDNSKVVDNSVFTSLMSRVDGVERKQNSLEADLKQVKDMLINLNATVERLGKETRERFADYEVALGDIESRIQFVPEENVHEEDVEGISYEIAEDA